MKNRAEVILWGTHIGYVYLDDNSRYMTFEYDQNFINSGIEVSPLVMPLSERLYSFPELNYEAFHGAPGLIADSLPDTFGNAIINRWLSENGRLPDSFNAIERLCYTGNRGMGALEYIPSTGPDNTMEENVNIDALVRLAEEVLSRRQNVHINISDNTALANLLKMGTSAGGARAKAIIAWNEDTGDMRSGQIDAGSGYTYWIIKFDKVAGSGDHGLVDSPEYTCIEYAYYLMAKDAGIEMSDCRLFEENNRKHFMTKRFDRNPSTGDKIHMQTLGALTHTDYNIPGLLSYEQAALYAKKLGLSHTEIIKLFRQMVFNVLAVNQDDHVKNISFLMDRSGNWSLAPAYDMTFAYNESNRWLKAHQMTINNKTINISIEDLVAAGSSMDITGIKCMSIISEVRQAVDNWLYHAETAGVRQQKAEMIGNIINNCR